MRQLTFARITLAYLALVLLLGGASAAGLGSNLILQLGGAGLIAWCLARPNPAEIARPFPWRLLGFAMALLLAVQLIPLPPALWENLPGRAPIAEGYRLLGLAPPWLAVSLTPWGTLAGLAWWIPAATLLIAMLREDAPAPAAIIRLLVTIAILSIAIGATQRAGSGFYFYRITNYGLGTGFFANANHQASFLLITLAMWGSSHVESGGRGFRIDRRQSEIAVFWGVVGLLIVGILLSNSLAGIGLLLPILAGLGVLAATQRRLSRLWIGLIATAIVGALVAYAVFSWSDLTRPRGAGLVGQTRLDYIYNSWSAVRDTLPFGWGLGSFRDIYPWYEPTSAIGTTYANHAHNDPLELIFETGVFGLLPLVVFLVWWGRRTVDLWSNHRADILAVGATLVTGTVLAHSLVDYPLRTAAISSLFAVSVALMIRRNTPARTPRRELGTQHSARTII